MSKYFQDKFEVKELTWDKVEYEQESYICTECDGDGINKNHICNMCLGKGKIKND